MATKRVTPPKVRKPAKQANKASSKSKPSVKKSSPVASAQPKTGRKTPKKRMAASKAASGKSGAKKTAAVKRAQPKAINSKPKKQTARRGRFLPETGDVGGRITAIVQDWAKAPTEPANDAVLSTLWTNSGIDAPFTNGAQDLVRRLNRELGSSLRGSDITTATMLSDLIQVIV